MSDSPTTPAPPKKSFFVSVGSLVSARAFLAVSQIIVLPILARYVSIEDFALIAMAMAVIVFCTVLSDAGLGRSLIRTKEFNHDEWSSVFWLLVGVGTLLALAVIAAGPIWAAFFDEPELVWIMMALAVVPFCQSLSAAPNAEVERREGYTGIASVQVAATVVSLGSAVILAFAGAGVWALVVQQMTLAGTRLLGTLYLTTFRPAFVFQWNLIGAHLTFARDAILVSIISAVRAQAAVVAIGRFLGDEPLGLFAMSGRFSRMPQFGLIGPMSSVVYVRMARVQSEDQKLIEIYLAGMRLVAAILLPILAIIAAAGTAIFTVFLSETWAQVAPIFAYSIPGITFEAIAIVLLACLFRAKGRTELHLRLVVEGAILNVVLVVVAAWFFDVYAVALAISLWGFFMVPRGWQIAQQVVPLSMRACLKTLVVPTVLSCAMVVLHLMLVELFAPSLFVEILMTVPLLVGCFALLYLVDGKHLKAAASMFKQG